MWVLCIHFRPRPVTLTYVMGLNTLNPIPYDYLKASGKSRQQKGAKMRQLFLVIRFDSHYYTCF